jgi:hypothetical protein
MNTSWLKLIGTSEEPCPPSYARPYADSRRRPRRIHSGDRMVLYAVGGSKRVFALAEVTSEVYDSGNENWPYRVDINYLVNLPISSGVHIDEISTAERDLVRSLRQAAYIELTPEEYKRAEAKLRQASESGDTAKPDGVGQ